MAKNKDLQPWLSYFRMLQQYQEKGFLEVTAGKNEAFVTAPALFALNDGDIQEQLANGAVADTARRIRAYAAWKSQQGEAYLDRNFALHVVKDTTPHDLLYTLLLSRRRVWWKPWRKSERMTVIEY